MHWYDYLAHFVAGAFLANGVPHFVQGICGNKFQTPFATPRGVGESSALVNVIWGWFNFIVGGALLRISSRRCRRRRPFRSPRCSACW
jgi:hypothetical protein